MRKALTEEEKKKLYAMLMEDNDAELKEMREKSIINAPHDYLA